jgi:glycosyltransferase involved in cell wall biosynthesis
MTNRERISVIVPTRDNERTIRRCLEAVRAQDHPDVELIVVDNHSTDATVEIAQQLADQVISRGPERSAQRNAGIEAATGDWVMWLDSDLYLVPEALSSCMTVVHEQGVDAVALPERTIGEGFWTKVRAHERECYQWAIELHNPRVLRRDFMVSAGAFDPRMSGPEDANLRLTLQDAGQKVGIAPVIIDHDEGRLTLRTIFEKRVYYGRSLPYLTAEHPGAVGQQFRDLIRVYARNWRILLRRPVLTAALVPMRLMEAVGYLTGAYRRPSA